MLCERFTPVSRYNGQILVQFLCSHKQTAAVCCSFCKNYVITANLSKGFRSFLLFEVSEANYLQGWKSAFDLFSQPDAAEILSYILEELCGKSIHTSESIRIYIRQLSLAQHASSILQLKTHLLFSSCLFQSQSRGAKFILRIEFIE